MLLATSTQSLAMQEPTLEELLANVLRNTGWIMAGGSAQFREGALADLRTNLHLVHRNARTERILESVNVLDEKATKVAASKVSDTELVMGLRRVLGEFEQAMRAYLAASKKR